MIEVILSVGVLGLVMAVMAVGVMMGRSPIKGSCGGMSAIGMKGACDICGGDTSDCESNKGSPRKNTASELAYDASTQNEEATRKQ